MSHARLPYRDDTFDGDDVVVPAGADVAQARARLDQADAAWRRAVHWLATAKASNRAARQRHRDACLAEALAAAADLRRVGGEP